MSIATLEPTAEDALPHELPGKRNQYSLGRAIRLASEMGGDRRTGKLDGLELEVSQEIARRSGTPPQGFYVPLGVPVPRFEARDLTSSSGSGAVATRTDVTRLIDVLRARNVCLSLGARMPIIGPGGNLRVPRKTAGATVSWLAESAAPGSSSTMSVEGVTATPRTMSAFVDASRSMVVSQPLTTSIVIEDLALACAAELDRVGLNGTGANDQPTGLRATSGVTTVAIGTNGGAPTWAKLCEMESTLGLANGDVGRLGWATTPAARSKLRQTEKAAGSGLIWGDDNRMAGMPALATTGMPANLTKGSGTALSSLILGNWDDLMLPVFGAMDVVVDPYKFSTAGVLRISAFMSVDVLVRHAASFVLCSDLVTT